MNSAIALIGRYADAHRFLTNMRQPPPIAQGDEEDETVSHGRAAKITATDNTITSSQWTHTGVKEFDHEVIATRHCDVIVVRNRIRSTAATG